MLITARQALAAATNSPVVGTIETAAWNAAIEAAASLANNNCYYQCGDDIRRFLKKPDAPKT